MSNETPNDDEWLDRALHRWAERPVGDVSSELYSQVAKRMNEPTTDSSYRGMSLAIAGLLIFLVTAGWWLVQKDRGQDRDRLALEGDSLKGSVADLRSTGPSSISNDEALADLQEIQRQVQSLQVQLFVTQMDAEFSSLEQQCRELSEALVRREQKYVLTTARNQVISDWLATQ